jgi:hypothetical protein
MKNIMLSKSEWEEENMIGKTDTCLARTNFTQHNQELNIRAVNTALANT